MIANAVRHPAQQNCRTAVGITSPAGTGSWQWAHATSADAAGRTASTTASAAVTRHLDGVIGMCARRERAPAHLPSHGQESENDGRACANERQPTLEGTEHALRTQPDGHHQRERAKPEEE